MSSPWSGSLLFLAQQPVNLVCLSMLNTQCVSGFGPWISSSHHWHDQSYRKDDPQNVLQHIICTPSLSYTWVSSFHVDYFYDPSDLFGAKVLGMILPLPVHFVSESFKITI